MFSMFLCFEFHVAISAYQGFGVHPGRSRNRAAVDPQRRIEGGQAPPRGAMSAPHAARPSSEPGWGGHGGAPRRKVPRREALRQARDQGGRRAVGSSAGVERESSIVSNAQLKTTERILETVLAMNKLLVQDGAKEPQPHESPTRARAGVD